MVQWKNDPKWKETNIVMASQPTTLTYPPRNKGLIRNQWLLRETNGYIGATPIQPKCAVNCQFLRGLRGAPMTRDNTSSWAA